MTSDAQRKGRLTRICHFTDGHPTYRREAFEEADKEALEQGMDRPVLEEFMDEKFSCQTVNDFIIPARWEIVQTDWDTDAGEVHVTYFIPDGG